MQLNLLVLRARHPAKLARFYEEFGCQFEQERHGSGPAHFACSQNGSVFEIYPLSSQGIGTTEVRVGFRVDDVDAACQRAIALNGALLSSPSDSEWGRRAVLRDPEGHTVELHQA